MLSPPPLLVTFALREESRPFRRLIGACRGLEVLETGIGRVAAGAAFGRALAMISPRWVITGGFAGALNPQLAWGMVLFDEDDKGPFASRLRAGGATAARFCCADKIAVTAAEKRRLWESTGADAVEMESEVIRGLCRERGVHSATVRVILDAADEDLPLDFNQLLTPALAVNYARLAGALARSPSKVVELIRFRRRARAAAWILAQTLSGLVKDLPGWC
jgi:adenosylhomocysteine nucleosidase